MKDTEIFRLLEQSTGLSADDVADYRPCTEFYDRHGVLKTSDAITIQLKGNGTLIYIPDRDTDGHIIVRNRQKEGSHI